MFKNLRPDLLGLRGPQSEVTELALSFGFRGIDLDLVDFHQQVQSHSLAHARRMLDSAKLRIGTFTLPVALAADEQAFRQEIDRLRTLAALAAEVGANRAAVIIEPASDERPYHQNFTFHQQRLAEVAKVLLPLNIRLGVGFSAERQLRQGRDFEFIHDLDALLMLLSMVSQANVGVFLDTWQLWLSGTSLELVRDKLRAKPIVAVQLSDAPAPNGASPPAEPTRLLPGETLTINCAAALVALAEVGYDGPVTPFADKARFAGVRKNQVAKLLGESLDACWKAAGLNAAGKLPATAGRK